MDGGIPPLLIVFTTHVMEYSS